MKPDNEKHPRYGMVIDLDRCNGCGACMMACAVENNMAPARPRATQRTGITSMRVFKVNNGKSFPNSDSVFVPMMCQQCEHETPCVSVCPQNAVELDPKTGIVGQIPERCLGCRYCMTACPYHARYYNWWDPQWPEGMEKTLNPDVGVRMRGVVEKCNFCHGRLHAAKAKAAAEGRELEPGEYNPACAEACPMGAITFGDLNDEDSEVYQLAHSDGAFRFLESLGTESKVYYRTQQSWVKKLAEKKMAGAKKIVKETAEMVS
jgi:molybdopterin-containing oxidoreductase family iron-sulfur binding subunit